MIFSAAELVQYRALVKEKNPPNGWKTWGDHHERCDHCCNGERCDDRIHVARSNCPYCLGTSVALWHPLIREESLTMAITTGAGNAEASQPVDLYKIDWGCLQWRQELHDRLFHSDIYIMSRKDRLTHLVLHLAKYNGTYYRQFTDRDTETMKRVTLDACIVLVSIFNTLNAPCVPYFVEAGAGDRLVILTADLCKLLEGLDHLEDTPFKPRFLGTAITLLKCWMWLYRTLHPKDDGSYLTDDHLFNHFKFAYCQRLEAVERKNLFYDEIIASSPEFKSNG